MARVHVLALDGADSELMVHWAKDGTLPTIRSLMESGTWCTVANPPGLFAGSVWPSFYTGVSPARHGKYCSKQLKSGTYDDSRVHGFDSRVETIWDVLNHAGKKSAIIDAPKADLSIDFNGVQIVDWATEDFEMDLRTWPYELTAEIKRKYGINPVIERRVDITDVEDLKRLRSQLLSRLQQKAAMSEEILAQHRWDFFFTLFTEVHTAGHLCWHLHDASHPSFDQRLSDSVGNIVRDVYMATDSVLAEFVDSMDDDIHLFVYSINGMGANYTGVHILDEILWCWERKRLPVVRHAMTRAADWVDARLPSRIYDKWYPLQRRIRSGLSLPIRDRADRWVFQVPTNAIVGGVRLNLLGREPQGVISADRYDGCCSKLVDCLHSLINVDTGMPVARQIIRTHELYAGEHADDLPDILVEWAQDGPIETVFARDTGTVRKTCGGKRTGDHRPDGILFARGPGMPCGKNSEELSIYDLAPTISGLLGIPFPSADGENACDRLGINYR